MSKVIQHWTGMWKKEITETEIELLSQANDMEAGEVYDKRLRFIESMARRSFVEVGLICTEVIRRELWQRIVSPETGEYFHSWDAWVCSCLKVGRSSAYSAVKVLKMETLTREEMRDMTRINLERLASLSPLVQRDPEVVGVAKQGTEAQLVSYVQTHYPEQHVEPKRTVLATPPESERQNILECFEVIRWAYEVENREDIMANLVAYFMDGFCEVEGYTQMSNREAFEAAKEPV